jgi:hypothetical protein
MTTAEQRLAEIAAAITHDYVSVAPCGCVVSICADMANRFTAKFVAGEIRDGNVVNRMPVEDAVAALKGQRCAGHRAAQESLEEAGR